MVSKIDKQLKDNKLNILFTTAWYPNRYDAMAGLFVRKHAEAVSRFANVCVLYFHFDNRISTIEIEEQDFGTVHEIVVYFSPKTNILRLLWIGAKLVRAKFWKPDVTHVNVLSKGALLAYWLKLRYKIPYVVTEHWSGYLPENGDFESKNSLYKIWMRFVAKRAACIMPVSQRLQQSMQQCGIHVSQWRLLHNVVDDFFYEEPVAVESRQKKRILHVSCFDEKSKNVKGILRAAKIVSAQRADFELVIVGTGVDFEDVYAYYATLQLPEGMVRFVGEQTPREVKNWFDNSDFFLLFSNYENAPVVISESLAVGKPILTSAAGGVPEMIAADTGIVVPVGDEQKLAENLNFMLDNFQNFDKEKIKAEGLKFSYEAVGRQLKSLYESVLS